MIPLQVLPADPEDEEVLGRVVEHLERKGLLAYPTETVYGLGGPSDAEGVAAVRALKGREEEKPFLVLLPPGDSEDPSGGGAGAGGLEWSPEAQRLARSFWPGPLTLVLPDPEERFPEGVRSRDGGVAVRRSPHPFVEALLERWRRPLLSTSANRPGGPPARTADEVKEAVEGRPGIHRLWILDGGPLLESPPSTVVDATGPLLRLLRRGAIGADAIRELVPELEDETA